MTRHPPQIVTFSGIDGAGKTTQIDSITAYLVGQGQRVASISFWDDVAFMSKLRVDISLAVFRQNYAQPPHGSLRNDKNVKTWYLTFARAILYLLDTLRLRTVTSKLRAGNYNFVIFDRYLYDQLVQINSRSWLARTYIRLLVRLAPQPEFAFVLDASPDDAFSRKPEYPLDFLYGYRQAFLGLAAFVSHLVVIPATTAEHVSCLILQTLAEQPDVFVSTSSTVGLVAVCRPRTWTHSRNTIGQHKNYESFSATAQLMRRPGTSQTHLWKPKHES
jgi:thymidylate kinase